MKKLSAIAGPFDSPGSPADSPQPSKRKTGMEGSQTYGQILKSSALIGGSTVLNIGMGIVRTKAMALLLGPAGVGLLGIYGAIADLARMVAGMGINSSGVRQIAEAVGTGDSHRIARTVTSLRRAALVLGILGALLLAALCQPVARFSFGDGRFAGEVALLALAVFFGALSSAQLALVQGMRRIGDLAWANVWSGLASTVCSILVVYYLGKAGIVPSLVLMAALGILISWWYSRKIQVERVGMKLAEVADEVSALLKLGFVFMASGLMVMGVAYLVRIIVIRKIGEDAAGFYQAAWVLGGLYIGVILQAMGADFYPRLTAVAGNRAESNRLVNEQTEVGLLLAGPGVIGTLTFAPLIIPLFYSAKFEPAVEVLRWICLGMMLRVVSWPMGFILVAKGERNLFFWSELVSNAVQVGLAWVCVVRFDLEGTGIAFFAGYVFYWFLIYAIVRMINGFRWSAANKQIGLVNGVLVSGVFLSWYFLPRQVTLATGVVITLMAGVWSARQLCRLVPLERFPQVVRRFLVLFRFAPAKDCPRTARLP